MKSTAHIRVYFPFVLMYGSIPFDKLRANGIWVVWYHSGTIGSVEPSPNVSQTPVLKNDRSGKLAMEIVNGLRLSSRRIRLGASMCEHNNKNPESPIRLDR
jgi:hypothetical protein